MTVRYDPIDGMLIEVEFRGPGNPSGPTAPVTLLVDTGATRTHITSQIADFLGLPLRGKRRITSATTQQLLDHWTADVIIPGLPMTFPDILVRDFLQPNIKQAGVLGRDILSLGVLHIDGPNRIATLSF
jgi:hypothetical protein